MKRKNRFFEYLRLTRIQGSIFTAVIIIIGYLIMTGEYELLHLSILFIIGILSHFFAFVLNEYADVWVDEKSQFLKDKPLVSGAIPKNQALFIAAMTCFLAFALVIIFFQSVFPLFFLSLSLILGGIYDIYGKKIPCSDFIIAGGCFFGCLFGASIVSTNFTNLVYIISFLIFVYLVFNTAVAGGLKDVDHDSLAGAKTTPTRMGVRVKNGKLLISNKFAAFVYIVKITYVGLIILAGFQPELNLWQSDKYLIHIIIVSLVVILFTTVYKTLHLYDFDRIRVVRLLGIIEVTTFSLGPIILYPLIGLNMTLVLLFLPLVWFWFFNLLLYGKPMQPDV